MKDTVAVIMIALEAASKPSLFMLLAADGLVNRLGTGTASNDEETLFIGITRPPLFDKLREQIPPQWFDHLGGYVMPDQKGLPCELSILMKHLDGHESGLRFRYGSASQGPPSDVCQFVRSAVELTEPWYEEQKRLKIQAPAESKPWWKFW